MLQKVLAIVIVFIGLTAVIFPFASGDQAYFIGDSYYINLKDSVDQKYEPYINSLVQQDLSKKAAREKKELRTALKPKADSIETQIIVATEKKNGLKLEKLRIVKQEFQTKLIDDENEIDEKYSIRSLSEKELKNLISAKKDSVSLSDYLVAIANELVNPTKDENVTALSSKDIQINKINQQSTTPFLISGLLIVLCGALIYAAQSNLINFAALQTKLIISSVLGIACVIVAGLSYYSFADRLAFEKELASRELEVKEKLLDIRDLQLSYFEAKNKYCNKWEKLIDFAKNDSVKIVKYLVNKDDTAAVNQALQQGLELEEIQWKKVAEVTFPNKKVDIDAIARVPYSKENFELNAGIIKRNERDVHVFEVKTLKYNFVKNLSILPENFDKQKALVVGSMIEPSTEGNW